MCIARVRNSRPTGFLASVIAELWKSRNMICQCCSARSYGSYSDFNHVPRAVIFRSVFDVLSKPRRLTRSDAITTALGLRIRVFMCRRGFQPFSFSPQYYRKRKIIFTISLERIPAEFSVLNDKHSAAKTSCCPFFRFVFTVHFTFGFVFRCRKTELSIQYKRIFTDSLKYFFTLV